MKRIFVITYLLSTICSMQAGRIKMPGEALLNQQLSDCGFAHFIRQSNIVNELADREMTPGVVALKLRIALLDYSKKGTSEEIFTIIEPHFLKCIFRDSPSALDELKKYYKFDKSN